MTTELAPLGKVKSENIFFHQKPVVTDWDAFIASLPVDPDTILAEIKAGEVYAEVDPADHAVWVLQQKLRLALLFKAGLPLAEGTCKSCGQHKKDTVQYYCLWCTEENRQYPNSGGRGSCWFIQPIYDIQTHTWGLLSYTSHARDDTTMFWIALGYASYAEARSALFPIGLYEKWLDREYKNLADTYGTLRELLDTDTLMQRKDLPFTPESFESHLRELIRTNIAQDQALLHGSIRQALSKHSDKERD